MAKTAEKVICMVKTLQTDWLKLSDIPNDWIKLLFKICVFQSLKVGNDWLKLAK